MSAGDESEVAGTSSLMESTMLEGEECYNPEAATEVWTEKVSVEEQLCRICGNGNEYLIPIFSGEGLEHQLGVKIQKHLPIQVREHDKLPLQVCYQCASTLIAWHDLVTTCVEVEEKLRLMYQQEEEEDDNGADRADFFDDPVNSEMTEDPLKPSISKSATIKPAHPPRKKTVMKAKLKKKITATKPPRDLAETPMELLRPKEEQVEADPTSERFEEETNLPSSTTYNYESNVSNTGFPIVPTRVIIYKCVADETKQSKYMCVTCNQVYANKPELLKHIKSHALHVSVCQYCNKPFGNATMLKAHIMQHTGKHPYQCNICKEGFMLKSTLTKHRLSEHITVKDDDALFGCPRLEQLEQKKKSISKQVRKSNSNAEVVDSVKKLGRNKKLKTVSATRKIMKTDTESFSEPCVANSLLSGENDNPYARACELCGQKFDWRAKYAYKLHMLKHSGVKNFKCKICGAAFFLRNYLTRHKITHKTTWDLTCDTCGASFKSKPSLILHIRFIHEGSKHKMYPCDICSKQFRSLLLRNEHVARHSKKIRFPCLCGKSYSSQRGLCGHQRKVHLKDSFPCSLCAEIFQTQIELQEHTVSSHPGDDTVDVTSNVSPVSVPRAVCRTCYEICEDLVALRTHMLNVHNDAMFFACKVVDCNRHYTSELRLLRHVNTYHGRGNDNEIKRPCRKIKLPCKFCNTLFDSERLRKLHMSVHRPLVEKKPLVQSSLKIIKRSKLKIIKCKTCNEPCNNMKSLRQHMLNIHNKTLPFVCKEPNCGKNYGSAVGLRQHATNFHLRDKEADTKFPCEICGKLFSTVNTRKLHMTIHTGELKYVCDVCGRSFRLRSGLTEHLVRHTDAMPVACSVCNRRFRTHSNLVTHERIHKGEKPYACDICGRRFVQSGDRNKHKINVHNFINKNSTSSC